MTTLQSKWQRQSPSTKITETALVLLAGYMAIEMFRAEHKADFWPSTKKIAAQPWGAFTFKDFYANTLLMTLWAISREKKILPSSLWTAAFAAFGSLGTIPYAITQLLKLPAGAPAQDVFSRR